MSHGEAPANEPPLAWEAQSPQVDRRIVSAGPGEQEPLHRHGGPQMVLILTGQYYERSFDTLTLCRVGDFIVRPAHFGHGGVPGKEGARYVRLALSDAGAHRYFAAHGWTTRIGRVSEIGNVHALLGDERGGDAVLDACPTRSANRLSQSEPLDAIATSLAARDGPPVAVLARRHGMTPWSLSRAFKARFGASPQLYRQQARLQRALQALAETSAPMALIADEAGFADQSHFHRVLAAATGLTPRAARRALAIA